MVVCEPKEQSSTDGIDHVQLVTNDRRRLGVGQLRSFASAGQTILNQQPNLYHLFNKE